MSTKFQVAKQDLQEAIDTVGGALAPSAGDITSHFLFRICPDDSSKVEVLAHSNRVCASCPIKAAAVMELGLAFTVEGWRLKGWLGAIDDAAVTFELLPGGEVKAEVKDYAAQTFRSLDPQNFSYWDKTIAKAQSVGKVVATRLASALKNAKNFASLDENTLPEAVVVEARNGHLAATDKQSVLAFFKVRGLDQSKMLIHSKDIGTVVAFLGTVDGEVEILESERAVYFKRLHDGAVLGETRYQVKFPDVSPPPDKDQRTWKVKTADLRKALSFTYYGAAKKDNRLFLSHPDEDGPIKVAMKNESGKLTTVNVPCLEGTKLDDAPDLPSDGFPISREHLQDVLDILGTETITLGVNVNPAKKNRYVRVTNAVYSDDKGENGDLYTFILAGMVW